MLAFSLNTNVVFIFFILKSEMLTECMEYNEENIWIMGVLIKGYLD